MIAAAVPIRTCLGCRRRLPVTELIGVLAAAGGVGVVSVAGRKALSCEDRRQPAQGVVDRGPELAAVNAPGPELATTGTASASGKRKKGGYLCPTRACADKALRSLTRPAGSKRKSGAALDTHGRGVGELLLQTAGLLATQMTQARREGLRRRRLEVSGDARIEAWQVLIGRLDAANEAVAMPADRRAKAWATTRGSAYLGGGDDPSSV